MVDERNEKTQRRELRQRPVLPLPSDQGNARRGLLPAQVRLLGRHIQVTDDPELKWCPICKMNTRQTFMQGCTCDWFGESRAAHTHWVCDLCHYKR